MAVNELQINNFVYNEINKKSKNIYAIERKCTITDVDIKKGWVNRYFVRQTNNLDARIFEIDKQQYNNLKLNPFYICIIFRWKITGIKEDVYNTNLNILYKKNSDFPGILNKLKNKLLEYYHKN